MCGFVGFFSPSLTDYRQYLPAMLDAITHRGPDDSGQWFDDTQNFALGHQRLSVIDLSSAGAQPMISRCQRWVLAFNGEIYNHRQLRQSLPDAITWRGHADTEVLLEYIAHHGIEHALQQSVGMFALALWDRDTQTLTLARDRIGEKPLYYGKLGASFAFASELSALYHHPHWQGNIDVDALGSLMRHNYIPSPHSVFKNIYKLDPGCMLSYCFDQTPIIKTYWDATKALQQAQTHPFEGNDQQAIDRLDTLLQQSLAGQMEADVPMGAFLSGGIDSSSIVALMQSQSATPIKTFSIGFEQADYNEAPHAKMIANHLKTDHQEWYLSDQDTLDAVPKMAQIYSEPFSDSSQIPTFLVSHLAKRSVTVSLSGDGGDELFSGYNRYLFTHNVWSKVKKIPPVIRKGLAQILPMISSNNWNHILKPMQYLLPKRFQVNCPGDKIHKLSRILHLEHMSDFYQQINTHCQSTPEWVLGSTKLKQEFKHPHNVGNVRQMMHWDTLCYLPNDILVKVDRAAMAVSLETRVPMLDHRLVEFAMSLPMNMLHRQGQSKWLLRQLLYRHVPQKLIDRPKMGFGVPMAQWLKGPLLDWSQSLLDPRILQDDGLLDPTWVSQLWQQHQSGKKDHAYLLWNILAFQAWRQHNQAYIRL